MVKICLANYCKSSRNKLTENITLHRFPFSNPILCERWLKAGSYRRKPSRSSLLCSKHFHRSCYTHLRINGVKKHFLKKNAVPSIFFNQNESTENTSTDTLQASQRSETLDEPDMDHQFDDVVSSRVKNMASQRSETLDKPDMDHQFDDFVSSRVKNMNCSVAESNNQPMDIDIRINDGIDQGGDVDGSADDDEREFNYLTKESFCLKNHSHCTFKTAEDNIEVENVANKSIELPFRYCVNKTSQTIRRTRNKILQVETKTKNKHSQTDFKQENMDIYSKKIKQLNNKIKSLKRKIVRKDIKIKTVTDLLNELKRKSTLNPDLEDVLKNHFSGFPLEFVLSLYKNNTTQKTQRRYTTLMKQFCLTLFYYSPKSYRFVRKIFTLPHPSRIRAWITNVNCEPGFITEVFNFLKDSQNHGHKINVKECALIFDSMSIREQLIWDNQNKTFTGYVDIGGIANLDSEALAKEALMFEIVSLSSSFKSPIAYFLTNGITADVLANLVKTCISKLHEVGVSIRCITCDGTSTNINALNLLNCKISPDKMKSNFKHPESNIDVFAFLDPSHMLKLARNALAEKGTFTSCEGEIHWKYIQKLNEVQNEEKLKFANSISDQHIFFQNKKMKVSLAAQTLSTSVANAIEFLEQNGHPDFQGATATVSFIRHVDKLFDILNSKNIFGKGYKQPIRLENLEYILDYLRKVKIYLNTLKIENVKAGFHPRKTFLVGFLLCIDTITKLAPELLFRENEPLKYFLTYKLSQDHVEILFSHLRAKGGWNNNPNCQQVKYGLRALLLKPNISISPNANVSDYFTSRSPIIDFVSKKKISTVHEEKEDASMEETMDLFSALESVVLSDFKRNILYYISGFIVRKMSKEIDCEVCLKILLRNQNTKSKNEHTYSRSSLSDYTSFQTKISAGGLVFASETVFKIIEYTEKSFLKLVASSGKTSKEKIVALLNHVTSYFSVDCTLSLLMAHPIESAFDIEDLHETKLLKKIVTSYLNIRSKAYARDVTNSAIGNKFGLRQKLTKIATFSHV